MLLFYIKIFILLLNTFTSFEKKNNNKGEKK